MENEIKSFEEYEKVVEQSKKLEKGSKEYKALRKRIIYFEKHFTLEPPADISFDEALKIAVTTKKEKS